MSLSRWQQMALSVAEQLEQYNLARRHLGGRYVDPMTAGGAAHLMKLARVDQSIRRGRQMLETALLAHGEASA